MPEPAGAPQRYPHDRGSGAQAGTIALFLPSLAGGGAERVMLNLAGGLARRGLPVDLVLAGANGSFSDQVPAGVRVVDLGTRRVLRSIPGLIQYLRRRRPSVLLTAMDHANLVGLWSARLAGVPVRVIPSVHVAYSPTFLATLDWRGRLLLRLAWRAYRNAAVVVAVSQGVADHLLRIVGLAVDRVVVIHNPIVFPALASRAALPVDEAWYGTGQPPVILGIGRLEPQKDFATLIRAAAALRRERPVRLRILGEGPLRGDLEALVREQGLEGEAQLAGFCDNPFAQMRQAGVVVLSSIFEGFGNVLVEAMACGTPVVSTDCPSGPAEILGGGRFGRLVGVGDVPALAAAIGATLDHPPDPQVLRARADDFTVDLVVRRYLEVLLPEGATPHA